MDIAGDCRYWPVSCWKQMLFGYKYLLADPAEAEEYMYNVDAHSLALTCLQLLVEVTSGSKPPHAAALFAAFATYWDDATKFHRELYAVFRGQGTWAALKKSFMQQKLVERTKRNLSKLKHALDEAANSVHSTSEESIFCRALKRMLSGCHVEWAHLHSMLRVKETSPFTQIKTKKLDHVNARCVHPVHPVHPVSGRGARGVLLGNVKPAHAAVEGKAAPTIKETLPSSTPPKKDATPTTRPKKFTHQRVRTTDNGTSMLRNVPDTGVSQLRFGLEDGASSSGSSQVSRSSSLEKLSQSSSLEQLAALSSTAIQMFFSATPGDR